MYFDQYAAQLQSNSLSTLLVLPLFLSEHLSDWQHAKKWLQQQICNTLTCRFAKPFGSSVFAVEALASGIAESIAAHSNNVNHSIDLEGHNTESHSPAKEILVISTAPEFTNEWRKDVDTLLQWAVMDQDISNANVFTWQDTYDDVAQDLQAKHIQSLISNQTVITSYHFGRKLDGMMSLDNSLARITQANHNVLHPIPISNATIANWIQREQNRMALNRENIGVIVHAHGSDFHWNESMRRAIDTLHDKYMVEFAFSMADQTSIADALARLQQRGAKGAILVRVFGRKDSFENDIVNMLGLAIETGELPSTNTGMPMMHHGHGNDVRRARIQTPLVVATEGGLDDHPLFALALLQRAQSLSTNPENEDVILVAHGTGNETANNQWIALLDSLAQQMQTQADKKFASIRFATWQEDWADKREKWITQVREWIEQSNSEGNDVIVIPARTNATGPENEFLSGLDYKLGEGFAGHPLFADWVESQIQLGIKQVMQ